MGQPISLDIPHSLGKAGVRQRLDGGITRITEKIPGGGHVDHRWEGDTMHFTVSAMGQTIASSATVFEDKVHAVVDLPGFLGLFAGKVRDVIAREAPKLLK
ncbi:polyhydroxyalkanoic acid system family protein [Sphingomonas mollis]|uniref:Polyhydroxyalkanoic acid system family protein n=1 Tax=Sphingomonas mollis TaxID=2795726 RepID=A0ABS0XK14_9SPHN|nr:polyhydroxyalkanoic acid system family protein [Sphingomonas sp. BT553]MBJ6120379.1 polyhydroxyalkanoic acid system family protein [Sphingomonas sp. BT553]